MEPLDKNEGIPPEMLAEIDAVVEAQTEKYQRYLQGTYPTAYDKQLAHLAYRTELLYDMLQAKAPYTLIENQVEMVMESWQCLEQEAKRYIDPEG